MGFLEIITLIGGVLKFPGEVRALINMLQASPSERHQDLIKKMEEEARSFEETGRPTWDT